MKLPKLIKERRLSFKIAIFLAFFHFVFSLFNIHHVIEWSQNAQWELFWEFVFFVDFPVSLAYKFIIFNFPINYSFDFLPYPISELKVFIIPSLLHSIIGTVWYFCLPILFTRLIGEKLKKIIDPKRMIFGLISIVLGILLFILCAGRVVSSQTFGLYIILISISLIFIGLFFIVTSFIFKTK
ncbi:MAG TPA: hypothetical protein DCL35_05565 [Candidatus Omnitrophica bacterium]|nr:hypothetical protein [Candidatus Omnitrophota bacterium]